MSHLGDAVLMGLSKSQQTGSMSLPDHRHIRHCLGLLRPLMQVSALVLSCGTLLVAAVHLQYTTAADVQLTMHGEYLHVCTSHRAMSAHN